MTPARGVQRAVLPTFLLVLLAVRGFILKPSGFSGGRRRSKGRDEIECAVPRAIPLIIQRRSSDMKEVKFARTRCDSHHGRAGQS
jgi:hypothetical protein